MLNAEHLVEVRTVDVERVLQQRRDFGINSRSWYRQLPPELIVSREAKGRQQRRVAGICTLPGDLDVLLDDFPSLRTEADKPLVTRLGIQFIQLRKRFLTGIHAA